MSKRTLLLADDSVTIQKVVNLTFADEGIDVVTVGDGDSAMEKISQIAPDVVLLDVHMPGPNGYQICETLRQNPATKDLPVVLLVGSFEPFDEDEAARVGANAFLTKPFQSIRQLVSQVTELMEASKTEPEAFFPEERQAEESFTEEARVEDEPFASPPPTEDIDSLYHQSFSEMPALEGEIDSGTPRYVDAGMDDEMIETSSFDSPFAEDSSPRFDSFDADKGTGARYEQDSAPAFPQSGEGGYSAQAAAVAQESREADYSTTDSMTTPDSYEAPTSEFQYRENYDTSSEASSADTTAYDRDDVGRAVAGALSEASTEFDEFSRTEQMPAFELPATARDNSWDEGELLDLPPIENGRTLELTPKQNQPPPEAVENKQVVSLSPEQMDIIVQKIVEKLSEKS